MSTLPRLVLASATPGRLDLPRQIGVEPDLVDAAEIDETPRPNETPRLLALRLAASKADKVAGNHPDSVVIAADTVVAVGRRVLPKAETPDEARRCLGLLSGRGHRVLTGVAVRGPGGRAAERLVEARLQFKRLGEDEVAAYLDSQEWCGKAGGYAVQGRAGAFVISLSGSYSAVVGLPLYESRNLLHGMGYEAP